MAVVYVCGVFHDGSLEIAIFLQILKAVVVDSNCGCIEGVFHDDCHVLAGNS